MIACLHAYILFFRKFVFFPYICRLFSAYVSVCVYVFVNSDMSVWTFAQLYVQYFVVLLSSAHFTQFLYSCTGSDTVSVYIQINGRNEALGTYCGSKLPPKLMSNGNTMTVEFRSRRPSLTVTGFLANYEFVTSNARQIV